MPAEGTVDEQRMRPDARPLVKLARLEAGNRGSGAIEAEHLLLALALDRRNPAAHELAESGLDYAALDAALAAERERSLRAAGIEPIGPERLAATARRPRQSWGASARAALARGHTQSAARSGHAMSHADVAVGILGAELGTVPRALAVAGIDRIALLGRLQALFAL